MCPPSRTVGERISNHRSEGGVHSSRPAAGSGHSPPSPSQRNGMTDGGLRVVNVGVAEIYHAPSTAGHSDPAGQRRSFGVTRVPQAGRLPAVSIRSLAPNAASWRASAKIGVLPNLVDQFRPTAGAANALKNHAVTAQRDSGGLVIDRGHAARDNAQRSLDRANVWEAIAVGAVYPVDVCWT